MAKDLPSRTVPLERKILQQPPCGHHPVHLGRIGPSPKKTSAFLHLSSFERGKKGHLRRVGWEDPKMQVSEMSSPSRWEKWRSCIYKKIIVDQPDTEVIILIGKHHQQVNHKVYKATCSTNVDVWNITLKIMHFPPETKKLPDLPASYPNRKHSSSKPVFFEECELLCFQRGYLQTPWGPKIGENYHKKAGPRKGICESFIPTFFPRCEWIGSRRATGNASFQQKSLSRKKILKRQLRRCFWHFWGVKTSAAYRYLDV